eukprot:1532295-Pleurochrysis_carterae.AAC.1
MSYSPLSACRSRRRRACEPTAAVAPRVKPKNFKQLGTPTVDAEELAEIKEIDAVQRKAAADAAHAAANDELVGDLLQDRQS